MVEQFAQVGPGRRWLAGLRTPVALAVAGLIVLPVISILVTALSGSPAELADLAATTLPRYLANSLILSLQVGVLTGVVGVVTAWLVVLYEFPGRRLLEAALLLPLAVPAFVAAFALTDFLEYAGPVQTGLRTLFGWRSPADYWFFEVRSRGMAGFVLAMALYPYVYVLVRAALREQSAAMFEIARTLGAGPVRRLWSVALPLCRPAAAAGVAMAMMETLADLGTVEIFSVQTLTTGIFTTWLEAGNAAGAAQIAVTMVALVLLLVVLERQARRRARFYAATGVRRPLVRERLGGAAGIGAAVVCAVPVLIGFALPVAVLASHLDDAPGAGAGWLAAAANTALAAGLAAVLAVGLALVVVTGVRAAGRRLARIVVPATMVGYVVPGAVLGLGLLFPLAWFDHRLADAVAALTGHDPGLVITGTAGAIVLGYVIRFFALAEGAVDSALGRLSPNLVMAARTLGHGPLSATLRVELPLIRASLAGGAILVFVEAAKELPLTLLLRPFGFDTLATRAFEQASLENIAGAAAPSLAIVALGLVAVVLIGWKSR